MQITLYKSALCPRCRMAAKYLRELAAGDTDLIIREIDVISHPLQTMRDGVRTIPTVKIGRHSLSGLYLTRNQIKEFVTNEKADTSNSDSQ